MQNTYLHAMGITKWVERNYIDPVQLLDDDVLDLIASQGIKIVEPIVEPHVSSTPMMSPLETRREAQKIYAPSHRSIKEIPQILNPNINIKNIMESTQNAHDKWVNIKSLVQNCHGCERSKTRIHPIFGKGIELSNLNTSHDVLFIVKSPSREEDLQGDMFIGSMQLLFSQLMDALKLSSRSIFATHASKCREDASFNQSDFNQSDMPCFTYLVAQVSLLKPKVIVLMGLELPVPVSLELVHYADLNNAKVIHSISPYDVLLTPTLKKQLWLELKMITPSLDAY